jgi:hypothetical protein
MHLGYVWRIAENVLEKASGLEVEYIKNKKREKSFVLIKLKSIPSCKHYMLGGYRCPGGSVYGEVSLYLRGEKIYFETFKHHEPAEYSYKDIAPNYGERLALYKSEFARILWKVGLEIKKYSSK